MLCLYGCLSVQCRYMCVIATCMYLRGQTQALILIFQSEIRTLSCSPLWMAGIQELSCVYFSSCHMHAGIANMNYHIQLYFGSGDPEIRLPCTSTKDFPNCAMAQPHLIVWDRISNWIQSSQTWLDWLTSKFQLSSCFYFPVVEMFKSIPLLAF